MAIDPNRDCAPGFTQRLTAARRDLDRRGAVLVSWLVPAAVRYAVAVEAVQLAEQAGVRRDLTFAETDFTPRRLTNVRQDQIVKQGDTIRRVYESGAVAKAIAAVTGQSVYPCPYEPEQFVITQLDRPGDTHGWHWDDYSFALVWVAETPDPTDGGFVECVPNTVWDKRRPGIEQILRERTIHRLAAKPGAVYLMRTTTTLHRVYPIRRGGRCQPLWGGLFSGSLN
ncbi:HalD/BesD family halogenase, partial [Nocardia arizonensis]|uniref:HalD/BesD family halogenase n=1 Tax=Nocardia arizonensis TaxID=1141647 RepID=UPI0012E279B0